MVVLGEIITTSVHYHDLTLDCSDKWDEDTNFQGELKVFAIIAPQLRRTLRVKITQSLPSISRYISGRHLVVDYHDEKTYRTCRS